MYSNGNADKMLTSLTLLFIVLLTQLPAVFTGSSLITEFQFFVHFHFSVPLSGCSHSQVTG